MPLAISGDAWSDDFRLSDLGPRFVCQACGKRGADVRPDFNWKESRRGDGLPRVSWSRKFSEPIKLPNGCPGARPSVAGK